MRCHADCCKVAAHDAGSLTETCECCRAYLDLSPSCPICRDRASPSKLHPDLAPRYLAIQWERRPRLELEDRPPSPGRVLRAPELQLAAAEEGLAPSEEAATGSGGLPPDECALPPPLMTIPEAVEEAPY